MRTAIEIPRIQTGDVGLVSGYDALRMATMGGAKALGMESEIGSLDVGKKADVIIVDIDLVPANSAAEPHYEHRV